MEENKQYDELKLQILQSAAFKEYIEDHPEVKSKLNKDIQKIVNDAKNVDLDSETHYLSMLERGFEDKGGATSEALAALTIAQNQNLFEGMKEACMCVDDLDLSTVKATESDTKSLETISKDIAGYKEMFEKSSKEALKNINANSKEDVKRILSIAESFRTWAKGCGLSAHAFSMKYGVGSHLSRDHINNNYKSMYKLVAQHMLNKEETV